MRSQNETTCETTAISAGAWLIRYIRWLPLLVWICPFCFVAYQLLQVCRWWLTPTFRSLLGGLDGLVVDLNGRKSSGRSDIIQELQKTWVMTFLQGVVFSVVTGLDLWRMGTLRIYSTIYCQHSQSQQSTLVPAACRVSVLPVPHESSCFAMHISRQQSTKVLYTRQSGQWILHSVSPSMYMYISRDAHSIKNPQTAHSTS